MKNIYNDLLNEYYDMKNLKNSICKDINDLVSKREQLDTDIIRIEHILAEYGTYQPAGFLENKEESEE